MERISCDSARKHAYLGGLGHAPPGNFLILQPLRLLLVASESIIILLL